MPSRKPYLLKQHKLLVTGSHGVGTTALVIRLCLDCFVEDYDPMIDDSYRKQFVIDQQPCILEVMDAPWLKDYPAILDQYISNCDGILLVYSVDSQSSFDQVREIHKHILTFRASSPNTGSTHVPIMLVRNKSDQAVETEPFEPAAFPLPTTASRRPPSSSFLAAAASWNAAHCQLYRLPNEMLRIITEYLDLTSVVALCLASKRFYYSRLWTYAYISPSARKGLALATELGCGFIEASAKTGVNVHRAFCEIAQKVMKQQVQQDSLQPAAQQHRTGMAQEIKNTIFRRDPSHQYRSGPKCWII